MSALTHHTHEEWIAEGTRLFGDQYPVWRFVCPACGHVAAVDDFRQYEKQGATPESATRQCIGRYLPKAAHAFGEADPSVS